MSKEPQIRRNSPISKMGISEKTYKALANAGYSTVGEIIDKKPEIIKRKHGISAEMYREIIQALSKTNVTFSKEWKALIESETKPTVGWKQAVSALDNSTAYLVFLNYDGFEDMISKGRDYLASLPDIKKKDFTEIVDMLVRNGFLKEPWSWSPTAVWYSSKNSIDSPITEDELAIVKMRLLEYVSINDIAKKMNMTVSVVNCTLKRATYKLARLQLLAEEENKPIQHEPDGKTNDFSENNENEAV